MPTASVVVAGLLALATPVHAQAPAHANIPDTPVGRLGAQLIDAINQNDTLAQIRFVREHVSASALDEAGLDDRVAFLRRVAEQSGGLDLVQASGVDPLEMTLRTRRATRWVKIYAFADRREPGRLGDYGTVPIRDPAVDSAEAWPKTPLAGSALTAEVERHLEAAARRDEFSGVVLLARGDTVVFESAFGLADRDFDVPNRVGTKFNLASADKMFTAVAVAQLVEASKLRFDETLAEALPEYPDPEAARQITIGHLLSHQAGLGMLWERPGYDRRRRYRSHAELLPLFARSPLAFEPGSRMAYSNEGFVVLGAVIERVSGQTYYDYVRDHIFHPAGMDSTGSFAIDESVPNRAVGYARFENDPLGMEPRRPNWIFLGVRGLAAGGGYSTARDLLRFVQALRGGRLVSPAMYRTLTTSHGPADWYGYGFLLRNFGGRAVNGHGGGGPNSGINSECVWFADGSWTVIVLGNYDAPAASEVMEGIMGLGQQ